MSKISKIFMVIGGLLLPLGNTVGDIGFKYEESKWPLDSRDMFYHIYSTGSGFIWDDIAICMIVMGIASIALSFVCWRRDRKISKGLLS